ncbi:hypothetical protein HWN39_08800 [Lactobacillus rhamnosus]|uniref:Uncharacterized protein n=1 Tax=Lacticaseibacillus rhamnosus TaxID=47715 RepID=A0A7Y7QH45_LACRH|nr:hypothetical protein [Lacticaseibacillus rhamnosus]NVO88605.1 hypothetical protein [Lacticaseibacillus rhamnosus]
MKKLKGSMILLTSALCLTTLTPAMTTFAAEKSNATTTEKVSNQSVATKDNSENLKFTFDSFVKVENNQFVLEIPQNVHPDAQALASAQKSINTANKNIATHHGSIDPNTKQISYNTGASITPPANGAYTSADFWWGTRYYFESNQAVYDMDHDLDSSAIGLAAVGALGSLETAGVTAAVGGIDAAYFEKMKSDLDYMNNSHPNNYLYMDVNLTGIYSISVM